MSNAMRFGKRTLAGVAAGALALGALSIAGATSASAAPNVKPKTVTGVTTGSFVTAASAFEGATGSGVLTNLMNLLSVTADDTLGTGTSQYVLSIRLDSAPADDTGTGFAAVQLGRNSSATGVGTGLALTADDSIVTAPTVGVPSNYLWTRGSVVTFTNNSLLASKFILRGTAPNAGTYGFTAWVNTGTSNFNSLEAGEPFAAGTFTVGGTPTAFAITPASASVGANQTATYRVTATDSAGRSTFPTGVAATSGSFANIASSPSGVTFTNSTPGSTSAGLTQSQGAAQFINLNSTTQAQGTAQFTAASAIPGNYAISVTPGGTLPGTVTAAAASLTVSPVVAVNSTLVTAPATASTSNTVFTPPTRDDSIANPTQTIFVPTSATSVTFRATAIPGSTAGQLVAYSVTNGSGNAAGTGVASGSFTAAIDANLRASVTVTATAPVPGTSYTANFGGTTYTVTYAAPVLNIGNLTTDPPASSVSFVQTATAKAIAAEVTDQFGQPLQNITVRAIPSVSAATTAITDAKGQATVSIAGPAATVTSQTVTFTLTAPLGSATPASSALTLRYTASGSPTSLTLTSLAGNVTATAAVTQNVDVSGGISTTWATNGGAGWFPVYATIGGAVASVPVTFSAPDTYFSSAAGATSFAASTVDKGASVGIVSSSSGVATAWVKPTKTGTVTVTATAGGLTQTITWKVANAASDARVIEVTPAKQDAAGLAQVTAKVTDAFGNAVGNAALNFSELGVGNFLAGTSTLSTATGPTGTVTVDVLSTEAGDSKVTVIAGVTADYAGVKDSPVVGAPAGVSSGVADIKFLSGGTKSISIIGERATVSGKPGIRVEGATTGLLPGKTVVPYVRFPGGEYTQGSARPAIGAAGDFEWSRKTGKKAYVYFTNDDGAVTSNRIIIAAS